MFGNFVPGFSIWRPAPTLTGLAWQESWANTGQTVSGALTPLSASEVSLAMQEAGRVGYRFSCPASVDIAVGDQVRGGSVTVTVEAVATTSRGRRKEATCTADSRGA